VLRVWFGEPSIFAGLTEALLPMQILPMLLC
jgi:hypothetical protein